MAGPITTPHGMHDALVILGATGIVIPAFARLRINPVIGFLLVGLIAGPRVLARFANDYTWLKPLTISDREAIEPFAELGIIMLLFGIGLELSFKRLFAMRKMVFGIGAAELVGAAGHHLHFPDTDRLANQECACAQPRVGDEFDRAMSQDRRHQDAGRARRAVDAVVRRSCAGPDAVLLRHGRRTDAPVR